MAELIRIVIATAGFDEPDRTANIIARALRDAGMEVVYTGPHQTPEQIVQTVIQEDADAVGLSVPSAADVALFRRVVDLLAENEAADVVLFGSSSSDDDNADLLEIGVAKIFNPGATMDEIVGWVRTNVAAQTVALPQ